MRVVYQSFQGRYSDSPRALYEKWVAARPEDQHVWVAAADARSEFPHEASTVPPDGTQYREALESADVIIANTHIGPYAKRPGSTYLQTWHGTPLKRIHRDALQYSADGARQADADIARWDLLVSPNRASTPRLRSAFGYRGEVLETGYPRNDVLSSPQAGALRAEVRAALGVAEATTLVLYAPTWRDDAAGAQMRPAQHIAAVAEHLTGDWRVMARLHYYVQSAPEEGDETVVIDVSDEPDAARLYLGADILVTDYSSVMFDFAITGKPMVFFAYDLEHYERNLRGFYFDFARTVPGPIAHDARELARALSGLRGRRASDDERYRSFRAKFCHLEDGGSTDRVLQRVWQRVWRA